MEQEIAEMNGHIVVCGWGQVGRAISATLGAEGREVVVIDRDVEVEPHTHTLVQGDATEDDVLERAGLSRASSLVIALDSPADNVYVTLSARTIAPRLFIVARATSALAEPKLYQAGADRVVNPHQLGGAHMAALVTQPNVAEFLDIAMNDRELAVNITEVTIPEGSTMAHCALGDCELADTTILAVREHSGRFLHHPPSTLILQPGDVLIALGTIDEHRHLRALAGA